MPNLKSAIKAMHQAQRRRVFNSRRKDKYKDALKDFRKAVAAGKKDEAAKLMGKASSQLDKAAKTKVILKKKASRLKARMAASLKKISA